MESGIIPLHLRVGSIRDGVISRQTMKLMKVCKYKVARGKRKRDSISKYRGRRGIMEYDMMIEGCQKFGTGI